MYPDGEFLSLSHHQSSRTKHAQQPKDYIERLDDESDTRISTVAFCNCILPIFNDDYVRGICMMAAAAVVVAMFVVAVELQLLALFAHTRKQASTQAHTPATVLVDLLSFVYFYSFSFYP